MKILVITGSPHRKGTTAVLAEEFIKGANESGHEIYRFDAAFKNIHPCIACEKCHNTDTGCVFKDDMEEINPILLKSDAVVLVTPIYYYAMNGQIKSVIDRFYANDAALHGQKRAVLITAMADDTMESAIGANESFKGMAKFLEWEVAGIINGVDVPDAEAVMKTDYPKQAYELGKNM